MARRRQGGGLRRLDAGHIIKRTIPVWACRGCGGNYTPRPAQCPNCGRMDFDKIDSSGEGKRWAELQMWQTQGIISDLRRQVRFPLNAYCDGQPVKVGEYVADFVYSDPARGGVIIEDYKGGAITDLAAFKLRFMAAQGQPVTISGGR